MSKSKTVKKNRTKEKSKKKTVMPVVKAKIGKMLEEGEPFKRILSVDEIFGLFDRKIIQATKVRSLLGIEEPTIYEKHPVAIKAIGYAGSIGLLHLFVDGSVLFVPRNKMDVNSFESTGLTFTIEPVSLTLEETDDDIPADDESKELDEIPADEGGQRDGGES